jgi:hypothetical protein
MDERGPPNQNLMFLIMLFFPGVAAVAAVMPMWREDVRLVILTIALFGIAVFLAMRWHWLVALLKDGGSRGRRILAWLAVALGAVALVGALHWGSRLADRSPGSGAGVTADDASEILTANAVDVAGNHTDEVNSAGTDEPANAAGDIPTGNVASRARIVEVAEKPPAHIPERARVVEATPLPPAEPPLTCSDLREARIAFEEKAWSVARTCMVQMSVKTQPLVCRQKGRTVTIDAKFTVTGRWRADPSEFKLCYSRAGPFEPAAIGSRLISGNYREVCREKGIQPSVLQSDCP